MKNISTIIALFITSFLFSQSGINYKAVIKNGSGVIVSNQVVVVQFEIKETSMTGTTVYAETYTPSTDANGIVIVNIGEGTPITGTFSAIDWGSDDHFLNVQVNTGSGLVDMGTSEFKTVPYAIHAENVKGLEPLNEGNGIGHRIIGRNLNNLGDIGLNAVDLSGSPIASTTYGATGEYSVAMNRQTTAQGDFSTAMGLDSKAYGATSTVMGFNTVANGYDSAAMGAYTVADASQSLAIGRYNVGGGNNQAWVITDPIFEIGIGSGPSAKANALTVLKNGTILAPSLTNALIDIGGNKALITKEYLADGANISVSINDLTDGKSDADGSQDGSSIFLGVDAGASDDQTNNLNVGIGKGALNKNTSGNANIAIGSNSMFRNTTGSANLAIGNNALFFNTIGIHNIAYGFQAIQGNSIGNDNVGIGYQALFDNSDGDNNVAVGSLSLSKNFSGNNNIALGSLSLSENTNGNNNIALGYLSLTGNTIGSENIAIGTETLSLSSGVENIAIGLQALGNALAQSTIAIGTRALYDNQQDGGGLFATNGIQNTAIGYEALTSNTTGFNNVALGYGALDSNSIGVSNTAIGTGALGFLTTGNNNTALGNSANVPSGTSSNQVRIGNSSVTYAGVQVAWTITSDERWKDQIRDLPYGLNMVSELRPVDYIRKNNEAETREVGFIAQEVQMLLKDLGYEDQGMLTEADDGYLSLRYNDFIPVLVKAIQEQQDLINLQKAELASQGSEIEVLSEENATHNSKMQLLSEENKNQSSEIKKLSEEINQIRQLVQHINQLESNKQNFKK